MSGGPNREGSPIAGFVNLGIVAGVMLFAWWVTMRPHAPLRSEARRSLSHQNLRQIELAIYNYVDANGSLPADGQPGEESWYAAILPFFEHQESDTPDDCRTIDEIALIPGMTPRVDADGYGLLHYAGNWHLFPTGRSLGWNDITDGLGQTLLIGEINSHFLRWCAAGNVRDPALGLNRGAETFGSPFPEGVQFCLCDGSVRVISPTIDRAVLRALATPDGGETVDTSLNLERTNTE